MGELDHLPDEAAIWWPRFRKNWCQKGVCGCTTPTRRRPNSRHCGRCHRMIADGQKLPTTEEKRDG